MEELKEDFLTPEERASLGPKIEEEADIVTNSISETGNRPTIITAICGYFFITWALSLVSFFRVLFMAGAKIIISLSGFPLSAGFGIIGTILFLISIFGYWKMKKWGVYLYTITAFLSVVVGLLTIKMPIFFFITTLLLPAFVIWTGFKYFDRMF